MPNAEYIQPKADATSDLKPHGIATENGEDSAKAPAARRESVQGARASDGINAEELWKPDTAAKVCATGNGIRWPGMVQPVHTSRCCKMRDRMVG